MEEKELTVESQAEQIKTAIESCFSHYEYHRGFIRKDAFGDAVINVWFSQQENPGPEQIFTVNVEVNKWNYLRPFYVIRSVINGLLYLRREYGFSHEEQVDIDIVIDSLLLNMINYSETGCFFEEQE